MTDMKNLHRSLATGIVTALLITASPVDVDAQGRGNRAKVAEASVAGIELTVEARTRIRDYYAAGSVGNVEELPPGIRRNLARGKPLPPGIARKSAPTDLQAALHIADGYEIVEVGLDVFLVEVATNIIHDVLMDVIR